MSEPAGTGEGGAGTVLERTASRRLRHLAILAALATLVMVALAVATTWGPTSVDLMKVLRGDRSGNDHFIVTEVRLPKALAAVIVGACLAVAGAVFQALIHNPLASPYVLGVSAGGSLGAVIAIAVGFTIVVPFAFVGAVLAIVLVYAIARTRGRVPADTLLLSGVLVNTVFSACIMVVTYLTGSDRTLHIMRWLVGGLAEWYPPGILGWSGVLLVLLTGGCWWFSRSLNLIATGDDTAERLGVDVQRVRTTLFFLASALTATAVSISGPIGFVGLIVPHIMRLAIGPDHRFLLPASALMGGAFLALADTLASTIWRVPLPVGLVTAFVGGPFFILLMKRRDMRRTGDV